MVMDSGPYPLGRLRVFAWTLPDCPDEGRVTTTYYDWNAANVHADVPAGFVGIESIHMRGGGMVRVRRWFGGDVPELLVDARALPCTDVGFLEAWKPGQDDPWRSLLRFDDIGDVSWVDWDAVALDPAPLKALAHPKAPPSLPQWYTQHVHGFYDNFMDRVGTLAWPGKVTRALWDSISLGDDDDG